MDVESRLAGLSVQTQPDLPVPVSSPDKEIPVIASGNDSLRKKKKKGK